MSDIVERIRSLRYVHVPVASQLFEEAAAEIERLRLQLRERGVTEHMPKIKRAEVSYTLTDEEREAIRTAEDGYFAWRDDNGDGHSPERIAVSDTLRKLLERMA